MMILLFLLGLLSRVVPHAPGFTALVAVSIWAPLSIRSRTVCLVVPLATLLASDLILGFHPALLSVYLPFLAVGLLSLSFRGGGGKNASLPRVGALTLSGGLLFFLLSNFAVWFEGHLYAPTSFGLIESYVMGLPFYRHQLAADFLFSGAFFLCARLSSLFMSRTFATWSFKKD